MGVWTCGDVLSAVAHVDAFHRATRALQDAKQEPVWSSGTLS